MSHSPRSSTSGAISAPAIDWSAALAEQERWLRTVIYARLRQWDGVEEVLQGVALAAVEQRAPLADRSKVAPWLYRLAVWQALLCQVSHPVRCRVML